MEREDGVPAGVPDDLALVFHAVKKRSDVLGTRLPEAVAALRPDEGILVLAKALNEHELPLSAEAEDGL